MKTILSIFLAAVMMLHTTMAKAQDAEPTISFYSIDAEENVTMSPGESMTAQAPLEISLTANVDCPTGYTYVAEWKIWDEKDTLLTRYEDNTSFTLTKSGGYYVRLRVTFMQDGDEIDYESEPFNIVISESKLTCPDGFSPNGDGINDYYRVTAQSLVEFEAMFFNRWGQKIHSVKLSDVEHPDGETTKWVLWDGKVNGEYVRDGVYFVNINAVGSDGIHYKIKKAVNVLKGLRKGVDTSGGTGG